MVNAGIPVMGHLGLTPQSVHMLGGNRVQGKSLEEAKKLIRDAKALEAAGAFAIVIECVPSALVGIITKAVSVPIIGIGAGSQCDGQILVYQDMLGMSGFKPKFCKQYAQIGDLIKEACQTYIAEVQAGIFPAQEHTFSLEQDIIEKLY